MPQSLDHLEGHGAGAGAGAANVSATSSVDHKGNDNHKSGAKNMRDAKLVRRARATVMIVLLVSAVTAAALAYFILNANENDSFVNQSEMDDVDSMEDLDANGSSNIKPTVALLLIDVQKDFHPNGLGVGISGSLAIPNADQDAQRIATLIRNHGAKIDRIIATLDSHHPLHIAHPSFWVSGDDANNEQQQQQHPSPFTIISADDIRNKVWKPRSDIVIDPSLLDETLFKDTDAVMDPTTKKLDLQKYSLEYATRLEQAGRFQLNVWPEHCLIGSVGHGIVDDVQQAMNEWSRSTGRSVEYVHKGQNLLTEMYSALAADVPVTAETGLNQALLSSLQQSHRLLVGGQAMSHCVNYTLRDIAKHWPKERLADITLLTDCASAVPGFEAAADAFQEDMVAAGVQLKKSIDLEW